MNVAASTASPHPAPTATTQDPSDRRSEDRRRVFAQAEHRVCLLQVLRDDDLWYESVRRRREEPLRHAIDGLQNHELPHARCSTDDQCRAHTLHCEAHEVGGEHYPLARQSIRPDSAEQDEQHERHRLGREHYPEVAERAELQDGERQRNRDQLVSE